MSGRYRLPAIIMCTLIVALVLPHATLAQQGSAADSAWDGRWAPPGVDGNVFALARNGDSLFVGGDFSKRFGFDHLFDLLMLDLSDTTWHDIGFRGFGFNSRVEWLEFDESSGVLYVGGLWGSQNGDTTASNIAKWDGNTWSSISGGDDSPNGAVYNVQVIRRGGVPAEIYVSGYFDTLAGIPVSSIARYREGIGWDNLGADIQYFSNKPVIRDFDYRDDRLWVGGLFNAVDGQPAKSLAVLDFSTDTWSIPVGGPTNGRIYSLDVTGYTNVGDVLLIGGSFTEIDDVRAYDRIAMYEDASQTWSEPGGGLNSTVRRLRVILSSIGEQNGFKLFVGGGFSTSGNDDTLNSFGTFNTNTGVWTRIAGGVDGAIYDFLGRSGSLTGDFIVGGNFDSTGTGVIAHGVAATKDTADWDAYGLGPNRAVNDVFVDSSGTAYYVGSFAEFKNERAIKIAIDGDSLWSPPGAIQFSSIISHVAARNDTIFIGGRDIEIDGVFYDNIAMWDGTQWQPVDTGITYTMRDMIFGVDGNLYVLAQGDGFGYWDGTQLITIPATFQRNGLSASTYGLANDSTTGDILIAGSFDEVNGVNSKLVIRWDGANFSAVGPVGVPISTLNRWAYAVIVDGAGRVFVGGHMDGQVWMWGGSEWSLAGEIDLCFDVEEFVSDGCNVWAAGNRISGVGACSYGNIARFNGSSWNELGSGVLGPIYSMTLTDDGLIVVGNMSGAGSQTSGGVAIWSGLPDAAGGFVFNITTPNASDTLRYGDVFPVEFVADSVELVQLEYSLDSGKTWNILHNRVSPDRALPWIVPDTNAEFCQIRIANAAAACDYTFGDFFTIMADSELVVHRVTRYGGPYYREPFTMGYHQFSFENDSADCWPESYYETIDYGQWPFPISTVKNKAINPDWGLFCDAMGERRCYERIKPPKIVNPEKYIQWQIIKRNPWSGSCYGFTQAGLLQFRRLPLNTDLLLPDIPYLYDEGLTQFWRDMVNMYWIYQFGGKHNVYDIFHARISPDRTLDTLIKGMQQGEYPRGLAFRRKRLEPKDTTKVRNEFLAADSVKKRTGHSILPYMIRNVPDSAGIWYVYVYDNNAADADDLIVRIDRNNQTWSYNAYDYTRTDTTKGLVPNLPVVEFTGLATDPRTTKSVRQIASPVRIYQTSKEYLLITDSLGFRLGQDSLDFYEEIPDAGPIVPTNPDWPWNHPMGYLLPEDSYTIEVSGFEDTLTELAWQSDSVTYVYTRNGTDPSQTDVIRIDTGLSISNPDNVLKTASLSTVCGDSTVGHFYYRIDNLSLAQSDSVTIEPTGDSALTIRNYGSAKTYSLILWHTNSESQEYTQSTAEIQLNGNSNQRVVPVWATLADEPVKILLDNDQDGTFEDSTVSDVALDAEEDNLGTLPGDFNLGQNYPNPFNPTTTIEFSLPTRSDVTLTVYNVLGREVKTLVDGELSAGSHAVEWDGTNRSGVPAATGVYFYRLVTEDYAASKKMLLLK